VEDDGVDGGYWSGSWVDDGGAAKFMVLTAAREIPRARAPVDKGQGVSSSGSIGSLRVKDTYLGERANVFFCLMFL
jgi:hypothetical protein